MSATNVPEPTQVELTVVIPSVNGWADLERTLTALRGETSSVHLEVLVIDRLDDATRAKARAMFPQVRVIAVDSQTTIPAMRRRAYREARGASVAVIEDHVIVPPGWARALLDAQTTSPVIGGSIDNAATERLVDRAAFLCEYSHCIPPIESGDVSWLVGNNVVYPRELLLRYLDRVPQGAWENALHDAMRADGIALVCKPEIVVGHQKHYTIAEYCSQRFLYSRSYSGERFATSGAVTRAIKGAMMLALPPVLLWRIVQRINAKPRYRGQLLESLPLLALFVVCWAMGDAVGAWFGPGDSLTRVR